MLRYCKDYIYMRCPRDYIYTSAIKILFVKTVTKTIAINTNLHNIGALGILNKNYKLNRTLMYF